MMTAAMQMAGLKGRPWRAGFFAKMYTVMYTGMGLGVMLTGVIFPAILLWCLTRPGVKSACSGQWKSPKEPNQPC